MLLFEAPVFGSGALDGDLDRVVAVAAVDGVDGGGQAGLLGAVDRVEQVGLDGRGGGDVMAAWMISCWSLVGTGRWIVRLMLRAGRSSRKRLV